MKTDQLALLNMILANPDDDTPRLVYADWLEENGEPDRAEFIRSQCGIGDKYRQWYCLHNSDGWFPCQELKILSHHWVLRTDRSVIFEEKLHSQKFIVRRGFLDEVRCALGCWLEFGAEIMRWHPVRVVRVTDKSPWESMPNDYPHWRCWSELALQPRRIDIPESILKFMVGDTRRVKATSDYRYPGHVGIVAFGSRTDAEDALSDALIRSAKSQAEGEDRIKKKAAQEAMQIAGIIFQNGEINA